ncbi:MAG: LCP family protein [Acidimicrobiales bacterium]
MASQSPHPNRVPNGERLEALGAAIERRFSSKKPGRGRSSGSRTRVRWGRLILFSVLGLVVVLILGVVADYYYLGSKINRVQVNNIQSANGPENILLVGSTDRCALKVQNKAYGLCQDGVNGINSDIVMIVHVNPATRQLALLSIPRDLFVPNARQTGANKIDAALYEGPSQLALAIEEDFAIPINHFVELNFDTFANVVNALGGVYMYFPVPIFDAESGLNIAHPGCYLLNGYHALQVVRARHLQIQNVPTNHDFRTWPQEAQSDIARIRRTHEFLRVLAAKVASRGLGNPFTDQAIVSSVIGSLQVDQNFSENHMITLARDFASANIASIPQLTYPVVEVQTGSLLYQGYYYGDVEFPEQPTGQQTLSSVFAVGPNQNSFNYQPLPKPSSFKLSVENGTNITGQAATIAHDLTTKGFRITSIGSRTPDGVANETTVFYGGPPPPANANWNSPNLAAAERVLDQLSGPAILGYDPAEVTPGALVTVQTGNGLGVLTTLKKTTTTTSKLKQTATTTTTVASGSSLFSAPTATNEPLEPYDPRACNAAHDGPAT